MERQLPTLSIKSTTFEVDVSRQEIRELANLENRISFLEMTDHWTHYTLKYNLAEKNLPGLFQQGITIEIPQMVELDPLGMSKHYGLSIEALKGQSDFDVIVNQDLVQQREKGALPIIDIAGHPFYVDLRMDSLRPKDDFSTMGIRFSEIDHCFLEDEQVYLITYNPDTRSYEDIDFDIITAIPNNVMVVEIPCQSILDPIGFVRKYELDQRDFLRRHPPIAEMKARSVPWSETPIKEIIAKNLKNGIEQEHRRGRRL